MWAFQFACASGQARLSFGFLLSPSIFHLPFLVSGCLLSSSVPGRRYPAGELGTLAY